MSAAVSLAIQPVVISLARTPERLDRFLTANRATGWDFEVFPGVDGSAIPVADVVAQGALVNGARGYTPGAIGNALSHRALWRRSIESGSVLAVFEDDVVLRRDAKERLAEIVAALPEGWEIVMLGYNTDTVLDIRMSQSCDLRGTFSVHNPNAEQLAEFSLATDPVGRFPLNHAFGVGAYLISPAGARAFAETCFPMNDRLFFIAALESWFQPFGIDGMMNAVFRTRRAFACFPPLAWSSNDIQSSTVQPRS